MDVAADIKRHGKHYTPEALAAFVARRLVRQLDAGVTDVSVLDPACGDGELLLAIYREISAVNPNASVHLTGFDIDADAISIAAARLDSRGISASLQVRDFIEHSRSLRGLDFNLVVMNPPYVRTQQLGSEAAKLLAQEFGLSGRIDLTHPFVSIAARLLKADGALGLISSNRYLTTKSGENIRRCLSHDVHPVEIYDLGDTKLFKAAVLPAVTIASRQPSASVCRFSSSYISVAADHVVTPGDLFDALTSGDQVTVDHNGTAVEVKCGNLHLEKDTSVPWRISTAEGDDWLDTIIAGKWATFGDLAKIRVGIKTTADKVFISKTWKKDEPAVEDKLLFSLVSQKDVSAWSISDKLPSRVLYPYDMQKHKRTALDIAQYPGAHQYLEKHRDQLEGRKYVIEGGRQWYEIWVPQSPALWSSPKIIFPDISEEPRFAIDYAGHIVNGNCYWISIDDLDSPDVGYLMLAVANSSVGTRFYDETSGNKLYSGKRRWMTQYVSRFPVPYPELEESKRLIELARGLCEKQLAADEPLLAELDELVLAAFRAGARDQDPQEDESLVLF